ncbi:MAG TPA: hypothetical protein GXX30_06930 [Firmicutes bacterium]|uniref:Gas vesicle protein n=1 Tax=Candidatus Fermentithermobacillus carboniphilus TaxID=3085328 RepID=A0AAT9LEU3_9FIRM|nr:MAG: gas vesicle protein [Candidatus Fermentithermobacillus carboniphilus]HHW18617.1 hypothetical protein [Candidatus Fermentithermobacillaceae bacterium]
MTFEDAVRRAVTTFGELTKLPVDSVAGVVHDQHGWIVTLEALQRRAIPDTMDILGLYEVHMSDSGELIRIERKMLRKRGETSDEA